MSDNSHHAKQPLSCSATWRERISPSFLAVFVKLNRLVKNDSYGDYNNSDVATVITISAGLPERTKNGNCDEKNLLLKPDNSGQFSDLPKHRRLQQQDWDVILLRKED